MPSLVHETVGVVGAGTMGSGIAQVAALAGHPVLLMDALDGAVDAAVTRTLDGLQILVEKGRLDRDDVAKVDLRAASLDDFAACALVVEAIVEKFEAKAALFHELEGVVDDSCLLATNTSSLSLAALSHALQHSDRFVGLHFFNPVPRMALVEVASAPATSPANADRAESIVRSWGKRPVRSLATPGFIVNRVARPYYAEAWRFLAARGAEPDVIDAVLEGAAAFKMGPFALTDLIGQDVNDAVTRTVWEAFDFDPRFAPSAAQRTLVDSGRLGRKSGQGVYDYATPRAAPVPAAHQDPPASARGHGEPDLAALLKRSGVRGDAGEQDAPELELLPSRILLTRCTGRSADEIALELGRPAVVVDRCMDDQTASTVAISASSNCPAAGLAAAIGFLQAGGLSVYVVADVPGLIVTATVAMLANVAYDAVGQGICTRADEEQAMQLGTGYPLGPMAWGDRWGVDTVLGVLENLENYHRDGHYRPSPHLRWEAAARRVRPLDVIPEGSP